MPTYTRIPREYLDDMAREAYQAEFGRQESERPVRQRNVRPVLLLLGEERVEIPYCGRVYELLPVSFTDGVRLTEARIAVESLEDGEATVERARAYGAALKFIVSLAPKYLLPRGRLRRVLWKLRMRRNPFRAATDVEVGELLGFFLGSLTMSRVRYPAT